MSGKSFIVAPLLEIKSTGYDYIIPKNPIYYNIMLIFLENAFFQYGNGGEKVKQKRELLMRGDEALLLMDDGRVVNLREAVSTLAMNVYANAVDMWNSENDEEKQELESKIASQSQILIVLTNALAALNKDS